MQPKAPGFWKFNNSLLDDEDFTSAIRKKSDLDNLGQKWDLIKMEIRGFTIKYSKIKAKTRGMKRLPFKIKLMNLCKSVNKTLATKEY